MGIKKISIAFFIVAAAAGSSLSFATTWEHAVSKQSGGVAGQVRVAVYSRAAVAGGAGTLPIPTSPEFSGEERLSIPHINSGYNGGQVLGPAARKAGARSGDRIRQVEA